MPPRFGSSSAGAAIDIALSKTATAANSPIRCLTLDLPPRNGHNSATPASPGWGAISIRFTASFAIDLFVEPDCCEILIDEVCRGDFEALDVGPVRHDAVPPQYPDHVRL